MFGDHGVLPDPGQAPTGDEVVYARTATTRTFETDLPGVWLTQQYPTPVNVETAEGWEPIDATLEPAGDEFVNTLDAVEVSVADTADADQLAGLEIPSGASVGFSLEGAAAVDADIDGDTAVYPDVLDGVDVTLQAIPGGIKETLTLASPDAPNEFLFDLNLDGLTAQLGPEGSVLLVDAAGVPKVTVPPGFMVDAAGVTSTAVTYALSPDGSTLVVTADPDWLVDSTRTYPVEVDPTLSALADTDDTYVTQGESPALNHSTETTLKVGFDGSHVHRSFLKFSALAGYEGMNIMAADLSMWQSGSGSCTASPMDLYGVTATWDGTALTAWPGPGLSADPIATVTSGKGHDASCVAGTVGTDLTRFVDSWASGSAQHYGLALRARNEADPSQHKTFVSADGDGDPAHGPVLNVLWSDPTEEGAPLDPSSLAPTGDIDTFDPVFEATYLDADDDDGYVVFFGYFADTGAFAGALVSPTVDSGDTASVAGYLPLDLPLTWRALAVDATNVTVSRFSPHQPLLHPSVRVTAPADGDTRFGYVDLAAELDASITDATSVEFLLDIAVVGSDTSAPYEVTTDSWTQGDGASTVVARIVGGSAAGRVSAPVIYTIANDDVDPPEPGDDPEAESAEGLIAPVLRQMLGATDDMGDPDDENPRDPFNAIDTHWGDCGYSEQMPNNYVLWFFCDGYGKDSLVGVAPPGDRANPAIQTTRRLLGEPAVANCPPIDGIEQDFRWMTGVTSFPGSASNLTRVVIFFREGCRQKVLQEHDNPLWDGGTAGVATFTYNANNPAEVPTPTVHSSNLWDARFGQAPAYKHDQLHGDGAVYRPRKNPDNGGHIFVYACAPTDFTALTPPVEILHDGECRVARAAVTSGMDLADLGERMTWRYLDTNDSWEECASPCTNGQLREIEASQESMALPGTCPLAPDDCRFMPQHFLVNHIEEQRRFIAVAPRNPVDPHGAVRVWVADRAIGPWSTQIDIPISCDGRFRYFGSLTQFNCYQIEAHLGVPGPDGDTVFGYYDVFEGSPADTNPDEDRRFHAVRFMSAPLCIVGTGAATGQGAGVDFAVDRCLLRDEGNATSAVSRQGVAAVIWRRDGYRALPTSNATPTGVDHRHLQAARYLLASPKGYSQVWSATTDFGPPASRAEFLALLWRQTGRLPSAFPNDPSPLPEEWNAIPGYALNAYRWAYATRVTCADPVRPGDPVLRQVAGEWLHRALTAVDCSSATDG